MLGASGRTEGDILIGGGTVASVFLLGGIALAMICATLPRLSPTGLPAARTDR
ncbi:hypothetical protein GCM10018773_20680 [Streptomyces candidus]|nr:hypothetical protein GCM10018773_20680 [Streptomyces candidus]